MSATKHDLPAGSPTFDRGTSDTGCIRCGAPCRFLVCDEHLAWALAQPWPEPEPSRPAEQYVPDVGANVRVDGKWRF